MALSPPVARNNNQTLKTDLMATIEEITVDLKIGALYRFAGLMGPRDSHGNQRWKFAPSVYRLICVADDPHTHQSHVVYVGTVGADRGKYYLVTLSEWQRLFTRIGS